MTAVTHALALAATVTALASLFVPLAMASPQAGGPPPSSPPPGTVITMPNCLQAPPQSIQDRATYTAAQLQLYGLPPRPTAQGADLQRWKEAVRAERTRVCSRTVTDMVATTEYNSSVWAGNYADGGSNYTEADTDFYVPCMTFNGDVAWAAEWIGIGGHYGGRDDLVQTGISEQVERDWTGRWVVDYEAWVDNTGSNNGNASNVFGVSCGEHMYATAWAPNCMYIEILNTGQSSGDMCFGPSSSEDSGEAIVERPIISGIQYPLADFGSETFYGVGVNDDGTYYEAMNSAIHDYSNLYSVSDSSLELASVGPIEYDSGDRPYDQYTITWRAGSS